MRTLLRGKIIRYFQKVRVPRGRRGRRSTEVGHVGDADGWSDQVVAIRIQAAPGELEADLVHRICRERDQVAGCDVMVSIRNARAAADGVQRAHAASVRTGDVIESVADREAIAVAEAVVGLGEVAGAVIAGGILARGHVRRGEADGRQPRIDRCRVRGSDGDESGAVETILLEVREQKKPVAHQRAAQRHAVLRLGQRVSPSLAAGRVHVRKYVGAVEALIAQKTVQPPAPVVGARLGQDIHRAAISSAKLGDAAGGNHLKLANDFLAVERARQIRGVIVGGKPVDDKAVAQVALPGNGEHGAGHGGGLGEAVIVGGVGSGDIGGEQRQVQIVAAIQRQAVHLARRNGLGKLCSHRFDHGSLGGD